MSRPGNQRTRFGTWDPRGRFPASAGYGTVNRTPLQRRVIRTISINGTRNLDKAHVNDDIYTFQYLDNVGFL